MWKKKKNKNGEPLEDTVRKRIDQENQKIIYTTNPGRSAAIEQYEQLLSQYEDVIKNDLIYRPMKTIWVDESKDIPLSDKDQKLVDDAIDSYSYVLANRMHNMGGVTWDTKHFMRTLDKRFHQDRRVMELIRAVQHYYRKPGEKIFDIDVHVDRELVVYTVELAPSLMFRHDSKPRNEMTKPIFRFIPSENAVQMIGGFDMSPALIARIMLTIQDVHNDLHTPKVGVDFAVTD